MWKCGSVDVWMCGCVDVWMCGCVDVWMCGCVDVWMCGCVDVWVCGVRTSYSKALIDIQLIQRHGAISTTGWTRHMWRVDHQDSMLQGHRDREADG